jgi:ribosome maturation factor RimP
MGFMKPEISQELIREAEAAAGRTGCEVVDLTLRGGGRGSVLLVTADRPGGITVEQCAALHREIRSWMEQAGSGWNDWRIEVSSPGLSRPLKTERDFARNAGRKIRIEWMQDGARRGGAGTVRSASDGAVEIEIEGRTVRIPLSDVANAHLHVQW